MMTLERYEAIHRDHPWLVWLPTHHRRVFASAIEAATTEDERARLAAWWQSAVQRALTTNSLDDPDVRFPSAA